MSLLEKVLGPGLAAPETRGVRRLRRAVVLLSLLVVVSLLLIGGIHAMLGPVATGAVFTVLLVTTVSAASVYFARKARRDNQWLDERCAPQGDH